MTNGNVSSTDDESRLEDVLGVISQILLFFLTFCFSATIHPKSFYKSLKSKGIIIGIVLQLIVMPLIAFIIISIIDVGVEASIVFMILLSSPGGTSSNFFVSIFNGDLSLSVAMTTISSIASMAFLPLNLYLYLDLFSSSEESQGATETLEWGIIGRTVAILVAGVFCGLLVNAKLPEYLDVLYRIGNMSAFLQTILAIITSNNDSPIWEKPPEVFSITFIAVVIAMIISLMVTLQVNLEKPEAFSVIIEVTVQNTSIAIAVAFSTFEGDVLSKSLAIPVMHGVFNSLFTIIFATYGYRNGWTYTPEGIGFCKAVTGFFQPSVEDFLEDSNHENGHQNQDPGETSEVNLSKNETTAEEQKEAVTL